MPPSVSLSSNLVARLLLLVGLLFTALGSSARAQGNAGRPPFRYGIVVNDSANYPEVAKLGFGYVKVYISWNAIEATPGVFTNYPDYAVQQAVANNLQIVALINNAPGWATASGANLSESAPPSSAHLADFGTFMSTLATHYRGQIYAYEIWSEPNLNATWGGQNPDPNLFASMLQVAGSAVHAADPSAVLISGGVANDGAGNPPQNLGDLTYIQQLYQDLVNLGAESDVDAIGIHPYPGPCAPTATSCGATPGTYFQRAVDEHNALVAAGGSSMAMWITEFGYFSQPGNLDPGAAGCNWGNGLGGYVAYEVDETTKANYLVEAYQNVYATMPWVGMAMLMNLDFAMDPSRATCDPVRFWSILTSTGGQTHAYNALQSMTKETPQIVFNPSAAYGAASGVVPVTGRVVDPTSSFTVSEVIASFDVTWSNSSQPLPTTFDSSGNFIVSVDVSHAVMQTTPHPVYVYALTSTDGWVLGIQGLTVNPQMNVTPESLFFSFDPTKPQSLPPSQSLALGRNDNSSSPYGCTVSTSGQSWLHVNLVNCPVTVPMTLVVTVSPTGLGNGTYSATITLAWVSGGAKWFTNSPLTVPVTLFVNTPPPPKAWLPVVITEFPSGGLR
jgi:hypothetical protein